MFTLIQIIPFSAFSVSLYRIYRLTQLSCHSLYSVYLKLFTRDLRFLIRVSSPSRHYFILKIILKVFLRSRFLVFDYTYLYSPSYCSYLLLIVDCPYLYSIVFVGVLVTVLVKYEVSDVDNTYCSI